jgi:hypothetical protein
MIERKQPEFQDLEHSLSNPPCQLEQIALKPLMASAIAVVGRCSVSRTHFERKRLENTERLKRCIAFCKVQTRSTDAYDFVLPCCGWQKLLNKRRCSGHAFGSTFCPSGHGRDTRGAEASELPAAILLDMAFTEALAWLLINLGRVWASRQVVT